jgi:solute carrier family 45 protein 1/2/4
VYDPIFVRLSHTLAEDYIHRPWISAWLGWFPILFYTTMYISDIHARSAHVSGTPAEILAEGTRLGSRALFFSAILAILTNLVLPFFTCTPAAGRLDASARSSNRTTNHIRSDSTDSLVSQPRSIIPESFKIPLSTLWAWSHLLFGACMLGTLCVAPKIPWQCRIDHQ